MRWSAIAFLILATAAGGFADARPATHHRASRHHRLARAKPRRHVFEMAAAPARADQPYRAATPVRGNGLATSMQYRLGDSRAIAVIGYNRAPNRYEIDPHEVNSAASTQLGHPDDTVGARVSVPF
ncbi:MAG TPA: hypothetical protein VGH15_07705 [Caulobacteraceae bacterium]|jgi:hypothetical protein